MNDFCWFSGLSTVIAVEGKSDARSFRLCHLHIPKDLYFSGSDELSVVIKVMRI